MIEALSKVAEVAPKGSETKSSFDPDKKIGKGEVSNSNEAKAKDKSYDPDKKLNKDKTSQKDAKESDAKSDSEQQNEVEKNKMEPPVVIRFKCPEGVDPKEFERQLKAQERGLNSQTVAENKKNREAYEARKEETGNGRDVESKKAQEFARQKAIQSRIETNQKKGMSYSDAKKEAEDWIKTQAALHNPDQIAGGDPSKVSKMGDAKVNSSIGAQWKSRVNELKTAVDDYSKGKTPEELANTKMNVKLIMEK